MVRLTATAKLALDDVVAKAAADPELGPFVFGVTDAEGEVYVKGGGYNVVDNPSSGEVGIDSVFWICSQTKMIAHFGALLAIQRGLISFTDPVSIYLPQFATENLIIRVPGSPDDNPSYTPVKTQLLVKHLFNFTSGLAYGYPPPPAFDRQLPQYSAEHALDDPVGRFLDLIKADRPGIVLNFEPGTDFVYGWSSDILGFVVEKASGKTLEEFLKQNVFEPLGMKSTSFYQTPDILSKRVPLTLSQIDESTGQTKLTKMDANIRLFETDPAQVRLHLAGVGLYSSARDYLIFLRYILQAKAGTAQNPILKPEQLALMFEPALPPAAQKSLQALFDQLLESLPELPKLEGMWQWTATNAVNLHDRPGNGRKKGSITWSGWANTHHFVDPTTGVGVIFQTQILPPLNPAVFKYYKELETALYAGLDEA